jgi:RNA polymerase sigma-70 factor (ECF subfamily)
MPLNVLTSREPGVPLTDAALVVAARSGEQWALEALFKRHRRLVVGLSHRILAGREEADDLAQDVFVVAFRRLASLENPQAFAAWLALIVVRRASKLLRRRQLLILLGLRSNIALDPDTLISRSAPADVVHELRAVCSILAELPAEEGMALVLRRLEGMELAEIARHMHLSLATVKRRLTAAETHLDRALGRSRRKAGRADPIGAC